MKKKGETALFDEDEAALYVLRNLLHLYAQKLATLSCTIEGNRELTLLDLVNQGLSDPQNATKELDKYVYPELQALTKRPVLEGMFNPLTRHELVTGPGRPLMDTGLIYKKMPQSVYQATRLPSHRVLIKYHFNNNKDLSRSMEGLDSSVRG
jgi:hypothetical protein